MKLSKLLLLLCPILIVACTPDPYEGDKARVAKAINTIGNTELQREVEFEKFEPNGVVLVSEILVKIDSVVEKTKNNFLTDFYPSMLNMYEESLESQRERLKGTERNYRMYRDQYWIDAVARDKKWVSDYEDNVQTYQNKLDSAKEGLFSETVLTYYAKAKELTKEYSMIGDTLGYSFDVIYLVENAKTTQSFTLAKENVATCVMDANDFMKVIYDGWSNRSK